RLMSRGADVEVRTDEAFLERGFGRWEGLRVEEIRLRWPDEHAAWRAHRPVLGLAVEDRHEGPLRVAAACRELVASHVGGTDMVVAHGAAFTLGITALLGLDGNGFRGIAGLEN